MGLLVGLFAVGCAGRNDRPELAPVKGRVLLDGTPLAAARVIFEPTVGRPSAGRTNDAGEYELTYIRQIRGAVLGSHVVRISTQDIIEDPVRGGAKMVPEKVPVTYNENSTLVAEVQKGPNELSFELTTRPRTKP